MYLDMLKRVPSGQRSWERAGKPHGYRLGLGRSGRWAMFAGIATERSKAFGGLRVFDQQAEAQFWWDVSRRAVDRALLALPQEAKS